MNPSTWLSAGEIEALHLSLSVALRSVGFSLLPAILVAWVLTRRRFPGRSLLDAAVHLHDLTTLRGAPRLLLGLSAVVEEENGTLSYWALKHPRDKPDFHCPDGFVFELAGDL